MFLAPASTMRGVVATIDAKVGVRKVGGPKIGWGEFQGGRGLENFAAMPLWYIYHVF